MGGGIADAGGAGCGEDWRPQEDCTHDIDEVVASSLGALDWGRGGRQGDNQIASACGQGRE